MSATIDHLILNSPYDEPGEFWSYARETRSFSREAGRRKAGYTIADPSAKGFDDMGTFVEIPLVNFIRPRVKDWRERGWPGVSGTTRRLLEHWRNREEREHPFFFCQLEAIETLVWLAEAAESERVGVEIPGDGGPFRRVCSKMATGSGKTIVMAMLIAWHILNKVANPADARFSKHILAIAPGRTVRNRLQVLNPNAAGNITMSSTSCPRACTSSSGRGAWSSATGTRSRGRRRSKSPSAAAWTSAARRVSRRGRARCSAAS